MQGRYPAAGRRLFNASGDSKVVPPDGRPQQLQSGKARSASDAMIASGLRLARPSYSAASDCRGSEPRTDMDLGRVMTRFWGPVRPNEASLRKPLAHEQFIISIAQKSLERRDALVSMHAIEALRVDIERAYAQPEIAEMITCLGFKPC